MTTDSLAADLHLHTTASDGTLTMETLPDAAHAAGVDTVAVTDHDRLHPDLDAPVSVHDDVAVIRGIELRVDTGAERVDLLGYAIRATDDLVAELDRLQRNRVERGRRIIERVESRLGVDLDLEPRTGIGRPHVARAIDESDAPYDYQDAFDRLIGADGPCYVARDLTAFDHGVELLSAACSVVSLAHPFRYDDVDAALELTSELDAVERYYPYGRAVDTERLDDVIAAHDLLSTGGSDAHGAELGLAGVPPEAYERFAARLPRAQR